jgi:acyl-CoA synthetase (AMP-forming)/AMP-acid ligase II
MRNGCLFIAGRGSDRIIVHGVKYFSEELERLAEKVPGTRPNGTVAFSFYDERASRDRVILVCETRTPSDTSIAEAVQELVTNESGLAPDEVLLVQPGSISRTTSGKRQRGEVRARYLRGELSLPARAERHFASGMRVA